MKSKSFFYFLTLRIIFISRHFIKKKKFYSKYNNVVYELEKVSLKIRIFKRGDGFVVKKSVYKDFCARLYKYVYIPYVYITRS